MDKPVRKHFRILAEQDDHGVVGRGAQGQVTGVNQTHAFRAADQADGGPFRFDVLR